ncbi:MAG: hypothetical protein HY894_07510 [Deltaproteobacteria bacterium]|nr:hypothetical protein [Deltaproteobacteria bacterium]
MTFKVVDTNVALVANNKAEQADRECVLACINALGRIIASGGIVLDDGRLIIAEHMKNLNLKGQPGAGDAFVKRVFDNQANVKVAEQVNITKDVSRGFMEFPDDPRLAGFDKDDRKFVAAALASRCNPEILNAVDSDWWHNGQALEDCGVKVRFLCPGQFTYARRSRRRRSD